MLTSRPLLVALLLLLTTLPATAFGLEIRLKDTAEVQGASVTLGEISQITPASEQARVLAALTLFPAPDPGKEAIWRATDIKNKITLRQDTSPDAIAWAGADSVRIRRAAIHIGPEQIKEILTDYLSRNKKYLPPAEIRFKEIHLTQPFDLPAGELDTEVVPADPLILPSRRFTIIFRVNSRVEKNIAIPAELEAIAPVVVTATTLHRGAVIQKSDITLARLDIIDLRNPCLDPDKVIGMKTKRSMRQGYPLDQQMLELPAIIHRGELVTIFIRKGPLLVTAKGTARHDAVQGEMVTVLNNDSKKEILCRADGPGLVQVEL
jgi:flagella basal body P-ring formation protein FlgA